MLSRTNNFQVLFKKYRLRAEFSTLSELATALADKGLVYEDSIFSRWQKGDRVPNRATLLRLIAIFVEHQGMQSLDQANEFLESAGEGYITTQEAKKIPFNLSEQTPFQVPNQIEYFTGREAFIKKIIENNLYGNTLLIYGAAGVGKSVLAIQLGYLLQDKFSDGVLWFRLDTSDVMDVLLSIGFAFGKDVGYIQDKDIRAQVIQSIIVKKEVLLIFDNVEQKSDINLLLPKNRNCFVIITSRYTNLSIPSYHSSLSLESFSKEETLLLFKRILGEKYINKNKSQILQLAEAVGYLPLALHIFAKELKKDSINIKELLEEIQQEVVTLQELSYGDKNLDIAINFSYELLDEKTKKLFLSLSVFNGKDFSAESVAFINSLSDIETKKLLNNLKTVSLIEDSIKNRYRIHPMIKIFIRKESNNPALFLKAAKYYEHFLAQYDKAFLKSYPNIKQESDNVLYIFKQCYELQYWDEVIALWNPLENLLYATKQLEKTRYLYQIVKAQKTGVNNLQKAVSIGLCLLIFYWIVLHTSGLKVGFWNDLYSDLVGIIPLIGGIIGLFISKSWGFFKSSVGRAVFFLSAGLFSWGVGSLIWDYYNFFLHIPVPYPSLADIGYLPGILLCAIGVSNLPHAIGSKFVFSKRYRNLLIFFIPASVLILSYCILVFVTKNILVFAPFTSIVKLFFDIAYPASDVVILTIALIIGTSFKFFGGKYKLSIYSILLGFCFQYIADFLFSYITTANTYYNGGITDLMFTISLCFLTFGVLGFYLHNSI